MLPVSLRRQWHGLNCIYQIEHLKLTYITTSHSYLKFLVAFLKNLFLVHFYFYYANDMPEAVNSNLFLYANDSSLTFQHKDVHAIQHQLNKDFTNLCEWFVGNKLSIHLGDKKIKCIIFGSKLKLKNAGNLNIMYNGIQVM